MKSSDPNLVFDALRPLAENRDPLAFEAVAPDLAQIFAADGIGLTTTDATLPDLIFSPTQPRPKQFPWHRDANLPARLRASLTAETIEHADEEWLTTLVGDTHLIWAFRATRRGWSDADRWLWMCVSQALARWRAQTPAALQQKLEHAAIISGRLSHDFGNYLTGIMGFTELSITQTPPDGLLHRYLQEVLQSARQGADWIHRLHLFCRRNYSPCWPTHLSGIVAEEEARLRTPGVQGVRFVTDVPADLALLDIEAGALQAVLMELVNNAREASQDQGTVTFTARTVELTPADCGTLLGSAQPGKFVELRIADDGPGFAPDEHAKLFRELFFSTKPRQRGLGLLVVYGILRRFRGGLRVPTPSGKGAVVQLYLPIASVDGPPVTEEEPPHVLLVHPNPLLFETMRRILEAHGCKITVATSPQAAMNVCLTPRQSFALIVTDVQLPQQSGFDLARRILDYNDKANFLFLHTQSSFHGMAEEELLKRFKLLRWPLEPRAFVKAVQAALAQGKG